jgi:hypothetical protein
MHGDLKPEPTPGRRRRRESFRSGDMTRAARNHAWRYFRCGGDMAH